MRAHVRVSECLCVCVCVCVCACVCHGSSGGERVCACVCVFELGAHAIEDAVLGGHGDKGMLTATVTDFWKLEGTRIDKNNSTCS